MSYLSVEKLLAQVTSGEITLADAASLLTLAPSASPTAHIPGAAVDLDRESRCGYPEVVYGPGKPPELIVKIFRELLSARQSCLATRLSSEQFAALREAFPSSEFNTLARTARIDSPSARPVAGRVAVVTAGSADQSVGEEAVETLRWMRCHVDLITDIGVAGPQRLLERVSDLRQADALVVAAGMEGALPSVVAGHVSAPVFAVPTSAGYGASLGGLAALLSMLNSCASNVAVVNIDAGFKAAYLAGIVAQRVPVE